MSEYNFRNLPEWHELEGAVHKFIEANKKATSDPDEDVVPMFCNEFIVITSQIPVNSEEDFACRQNIFDSSTIPPHTVGNLVMALDFMRGL